MSKFIKTFENFNEPDRYKSDDWGYYEDEYTGDADFLTEFLTKEFGKEQQETSSADWGGIQHWLVKGDKLDGIFIGIDDDDLVFVINRNSDESIDDTDLGSASNINELEELVFKLKRKYK